LIQFEGKTKSITLKEFHNETMKKECKFFKVSVCVIETLPKDCNEWINFQDNATKKVLSFCEVHREYNSKSQKEQLQQYYSLKFMLNDHSVMWD